MKCQFFSVNLWVQSVFSKSSGTFFVKLRGPWVWFSLRGSVFLQSYVNRGHDFHYVKRLSAKFCGKIKVWTNCCVV
jgi:hypothetical protein